MKSFTRSLRALFTASLVAAGYAAAQQPPHPQEPQHQHQKPEQNPAQDQSKQEMQHGEHQMTMRTVEPVYPRMGKAQEQEIGRASCRERGWSTMMDGERMRKVRTWTAKRG